MSLIQFFEWFPELSEAETLTISLSKRDADAYGLPAAQYFCIESICPNPDCDCREVAIRVIGDCFSGSLAHLRIELNDQGPPKIREDQEIAQTNYTDKIVRLLSNRLSADRRLVDQLKRHYSLVKKRASRDTARRQFFSDQPATAGVSPRSRK